MDLTRRDFIKVSGICLCSGLLPAFGKAANCDCPACKAVNLSTARCFSCGRGLTEHIGCKDCSKKYNCLQIPFPNREYLIDTDKPILTMEEVNF